MQSHFACPYCGGTVAVTVSAAGHSVRCPHCRQDFAIGGIAAPPPRRAPIVAIAVGAQPPKRTTFFDTLKRGFTQFVDSGREERLAQQGRELYNRVAVDGKRFSLEISAAHLGIDPLDLVEVSGRAFQKVTEKLWADNELTPAEQQLMEWAQQALRVSPQRGSELKWQAGIEAFERALARSFDDGVVAAHEGEQLERIARALGTNAATLTQRYFLEKGESLLRGMFLTAVGNGELLPAEWQTILESTARIGLSRQQLLEAIATPAQAFVEHILADAKADNRLEPEEQSSLEFLLDNLALPDRFRAYVRAEIRELLIFSDIENGRLPSLASAGEIQIKSGEIVHFCHSAMYTLVKQTRKGQRLDTTKGTVAVTDHRFIFSSFERSLNVNLSKVLSCVWGPRGIEVRSATKGGGFYEFGTQNRLAIAILITAVGRANQTIVERFEGSPSRNIPREVKQRVWQRYGGRCADCNAAEYLEYDHVIPVAKGGSNFDNNVQILCRKCNLKKSDRI